MATIQVRDKKIGIATTLKARGSYKVSVENAGKFITKLIGNNVYALQPQDLDNFFFNEFQSKIKSTIATKLNEQQEELLGIDAKIDTLSSDITPIFQTILDDYGLKCVNFVISAIDIDDNELRKKYDEIEINMHEQKYQGDITARNTILQGEAETQVERMKGEVEVEIKIKQGLADAQIMLAEGKTKNEIMQLMGIAGWTKEQTAEILKILAGNPGGGGIAAAGAGFGMGMAVTGPFASLATQFISPITNMDNTGNKNDASVSNRFEEVNNENNDVDPIEALENLKNAGIINDDDFAKKMKGLKSAKSLLDAGLITKETYIKGVKDILS